MPSTANAQAVFRLLDERGVRYTVLPHREAFTAQGVAAVTHVSGWHLAKVLVVREKQGSPFVVVLPASCRLDLDTLGAVTHRSDLMLVPEHEIRPLFPDCETGALPPFGHLYGLKVYVDTCLAKTDEFVFQAGNHHEVARISYVDFARLEDPVVAEFCRH